MSDHEFKVVLVGNSGVGKSALLGRFVDDKFTADTHSTIGVDFRFRSLETPGGDKVKLQIWDTAGQDTFRSIVSAYYNGANAIVIVFDLSKPDSFQDLRDFWFKEV
jgi:small GTP-binding protein